MTHTSNAITLTDITNSLSTADHLGSLILSVQTAQQIVVVNGQTPSRLELGILPWRDLDALLTWWSLAQERDSEIIWASFLAAVAGHLAQAQSEVVVLKLAYHPTLQQLDELTELIRARFTTTALLAVEHQSEVVAGCIIETHGQRFDFSAQTWLPQFMGTQTQPTSATSITTGQTFS